MSLLLLFAPKPKLGTLADNFDNNTQDTTKWIYLTGGSGTLAEVNSQMEMYMPAASTASTFAEIDSVGYYDLTGSSAYIKTVETPNVATTANAIFYIFTNSSNWFRFVLEQGTLYAQRRNAGVQATVSSVAFNSTTHRWWRIREAAGVVYYDYSSDGIAWTNLTTYTHGMTVTAMQVILNASCYTVVSNPGNFKFDNLNTAGATATGQIKYYSGTVFVAKPVKVWNGTAWVVKPVKRWNGTTWITTPY